MFVMESKLQNMNALQKTIAFSRLFAKFISYMYNEFRGKEKLT